MPKLVYITILSQPKLSVCGVIGYTPGAWARLLGVERQEIHKCVLTLQETNFVVLSEPTEELLGPNVDEERRNPRQALHGHLHVERVLDHSVRHHPGTVSRIVGVTVP